MDGRSPPFWKAIAGRTNRFRGKSAYYKRLLKDVFYAIRGRTAREKTKRKEKTKKIGKKVRSGAHFAIDIATATDGSRI